MYCKKCNITFNDDMELYLSEYINPCPLCSAKIIIKRLQSTLKITNNNLQIYKTCEECKNNFGDCDKSTDSCKKLSQYFI